MCYALYREAPKDSKKALRFIFPNINERVFWRFGTDMCEIQSGWAFRNKILFVNIIV